MKLREGLRGSSHFSSCVVPDKLANTLAPVFAVWLAADVVLSGTVQSSLKWAFI